MWLIAGDEAGEQTYAVVVVDGEVVDLAELGFDATASVMFIEID